MLVVEIFRYTFYAFDFIFSVLAWGLTSSKLKLSSGFCLLADSTERAQSTATCNVVIAFGVILLIILLMVIVLRTLDLFGIIRFPRIIEFLLFLFMALIWFILAIVTVSVTSSEARKLSEVRGVIAGAWISVFTHCASAMISLFARRRDDTSSESSKE